MLSLLLTAMKILCLAEFTVGILLNGFIVAANAISWLEMKHIDSIDLILTSLGLSRLGLLIMWVIHIRSEVYEHVGIMEVLSVFFAYCSLWFGTVLCVFYCVKITNYNHRFFFYVKLRISKMIPWLLFVSVTISFICSLPFEWIMNDAMFPYNSTNGTSGTNMAAVLYIPFITYSAGNVVPFFLFCVAITLLIRSLWKHTRHMAGGETGFGNSQLQAHYNAIKCMMSFMLLYIVFLSSSMFLALPMVLKNNLLLMLCFFIAGSYPSLHSPILILSSRKLRRALCCFLSYTSTFTSELSPCQ
ncbi:taste receptor type 2 member 39 [Xenopus laevis]|uniref:Taste receptor type 2 n=1 Tax=Xenopus laevis TaxID=8355 RepID=A0A8J0V9U7_XENLA|nr:taste receptor type 2 member 39 [Xenopus laevis]